MSATTLGVIFGNRDFFPDHLVTKARKDILALFQKLNIGSVLLSEEDTKLGGVETFQDAQKCAALFKKNNDKIGGILVVLPNFGDEKGVADTIKLSGLKVPILVQGYPDDLEKMNVASRRDAYCGKISVCNNLRQANIPYTLTTKHVVYASDPSFKQDLLNFTAVCRVVNGVKNARLGAIGARPGAFNTVRYSEKILEANGVSVITVDLSEILGKFEKLSAEDNVVKNRLDEIKAYANVKNVPEQYLVKMARLGVVLMDFINENALDATAIQCWNSMQTNFGINVCTNMSMMSQDLMPSACEVDVTGVLTMYAMQLVSNQPSALADWNNNYGQKEDKVVMFHCGNWARSFIPNATISTAPILGSTLGEENTYGALEGRTPANPLTFGRITTDDLSGKIRAYIGEGQLTDDELDTFGTRAVAHIPNLEGLMRHVCENGFEHHVVMNVSKTADILAEAFQKYLNWDVYYHEKS